MITPNPSPADSSQSPISSGGNPDADRPRFGAPFEIVEPPRLRFEGNLRHRASVAYVLGWSWAKKHWVVSSFVVLICSCSFVTRDRTVTWNEEVPLNTGETIWVKRTVTYVYQGAGGNPLDMAYRPDWTETLAFEWGGKAYSYTGKAGVMLLAISPNTKEPVLVARADIKSWDVKHNYRCAVPFYVQLVPSVDGRNWAWPQGIESWLHGMPYNLMYHRSSQGKVQSKYTAADRLVNDSVTRHQSPSLVLVDPNYKSDQCMK